MRKISAVLAALLCLPLTPAQASGLRLYSEIQKDWSTVYSSDRPRLEGLFKKIKDLNVIGSAPGAGQIPGGWGDDDDLPTTPTAPKTTVVFPVHGFAGSDYQQLLQTSSDLAILRLKISDFIGFGPEGDQTLADPQRTQANLADMSHAIEVESAVIALGFYLQSPNLAGKCRHADDMKAILATLGRRPPFTQIPAAWNEYEKAVKDGMGTLLAAIPGNICQFRTVINKAQTDQWLASAIDAAVEETMQKHLLDYSALIQGNNNALGAKWSESATDVSLRPLFSVQRGFQNAIDILSLVQKDLNGLAKDLGQLSTKAGSLKNSRPSSIQTAESDLQAFRGEVGKFMLLLKALPNTPGLTSLTICPSIDPTASFLSMQKPMQDCLGQFIAAYKLTIATPKTPDPATDAFAQLLNQIMSKHLKQWE